MRLAPLNQLIEREFSTLANVIILKYRMLVIITNQ